MSWDIFVQDMPKDGATIADIPNDFKPATLGPRAVIISRIKDILPHANFADPAWGVIDGPNWSIEVSLGDREECGGFAFHVRGGDEAASVVAAILDHLQLRAFDAQSGEFFRAGPEAVESLRKWRTYRNGVVGNDG